MKLVLDLFFIFFLIGYSSHKSRILFVELRVFCCSVGITLPKLRQIRLSLTAGFFPCRSPLGFPSFLASGAEK